MRAAAGSIVSAARAALPAPKVAKPRADIPSNRRRDIAWVIRLSPSSEMYTKSPSGSAGTVLLARARSPDKPWALNIPTQVCSGRAKFKVPGAPGGRPRGAGVPASGPDRGGGRAAPVADLPPARSLPAGRPRARRARLPWPAPRRLPKIDTSVALPWASSLPTDFPAAPALLTVSIRSSVIWKVSPKSRA